jgi:hypothetical protein
VPDAGQDDQSNLKTFTGFFTDGQQHIHQSPGILGDAITELGRVPAGFKTQDTSAWA